MPSANDQTQQQAPSKPPFQFDSIESALADLKAGRQIVVVDDESRENEGDLICAAQFATPDAINFMAVEARGLICLAMTGARLDELGLPLMVNNNPDGIDQTAFTISIDAATHLGVTTGISADDRARTIQVAINPSTQASDLRRPGHIFPLRARQGGVLKRAGHTEAGVDMARLAGLYPAAVICEIQNLDGSMARLTELVEYSHKHQLKFVTIADLISYRLKHERFICRETVADLPTRFGRFKVYAYRNSLDDTEHLAIVKGSPEQFKDRPVMVRVHSECLTGDALGSLRCDCRMQLQSALKMIENAGQGVLVYLRQEGRGIGLINKLRAYALQDLGLDTVEANERLGFPPDLRNYGVGAQILNDLGVNQICLITNNPRKIAGLRGYGLEVVDRVPLLIEATSFNIDYLATKAEKLGHLLLQTYLATVALHWTGAPKTTAEYGARLEALRKLAKDCNLCLQEDERPVAIALFNYPAVAVHLGFDQPNLAEETWFQDKNHPYVEAITQLLDELSTWPSVAQISLLIATGTDPLKNLSADLDRERLPRDQPPSELCQPLQPQKIYIFQLNRGNIDRNTE